MPIPQRDRAPETRSLPGGARRARPRLRSLAFLLAGSLAACAAPPPPPPPDATAAPVVEPVTDYVIGPGDALGIFVYRAPELSVEVPVRPDGRISIPLVPDIQASGRTPTQLAGAIQDKLREYVREPNVTVMVRSFVGPGARMVRVIGEAAVPLALPYRDGMTLLDVLISARGLTRYAAGNKAEIIRRGPGGGAPQVIPVRLSALLRDGDVSQDVPMHPGDTLVIPQSWF